MTDAVSHDAVDDPAPDRDLLGHPRGLFYLACTEAGERFSYYGMMGLLTLYMTHQLLTPGHIEHIIGFTPFRTAVEAVFGPLSLLALASQIFGLYTGFVYVTPIIGGFISDRWIGQRLAVILGALMMAAGHLVMTFEPLFLLALLLLVLGSGLIKGNMYVQVGRLYGQDDPRRTRAFAIYLIALNVGAFTAPLICGTLGETVGWHYGFAAAAVIMMLAVGVYLAGMKYLPPDRLRLRGTNKSPTPSLARADRRIILGLGLLLIPYILAFTPYNQAFNIFMVWADSDMDRHIFGFQMPVTWFSTFDGVFTIIAVTAVIPLWAWQAKRSMELTDVGKIAIGLCLGCAGLLVLAASAVFVGSGAGKVSPWPAFLFFMFSDAMIPFVDTVTTAAYSRDAPETLKTTMMGVLLMAVAICNMGVGWLGRFYETITHAQFWLLHAAVAGSGIVFLALFGRRLQRMITPASERA